MAILQAISLNARIPLEAASHSLILLALLQLDAKHRTAMGQGAWVWMLACWPSVKWRDITRDSEVKSGGIDDQRL